MSGVAIIGWGSLIWDLDDLAPRVAGDWAMGAGPPLPLEFSRVSAKRLGALAVCIDAEHGTDCPTHVIVSRRRSVGRALVDLALRERAPPGRIGAVSVGSGARRLAHGRSAAVVARVADWCRTAGFDGAVWTDLDANFAEKTGSAFGMAAAEAYLAGLEGASRVEAVRYITQAPAATDTALRRHLGAQAWWRREAAVMASPRIGADD
ncbi:MAG: hypothetical protein AAFQ88_03350 [Pseudomonadota bacterium]